MRLRWAFAAVVLITSSLSAGVVNSKLDAFIEAELAASAAPGLAYVRVEDGEVLTRGFGEQVVGSGESISADTLFPIGSVTKSFTALAIMQLVEAEKLDLDDPVSAHIATFADNPASDITLRQLLNHTSGYSTVQGNNHHGEVEASQLELIEYVRQLALITPARTPGAGWEYSNANYQILGAVIEQASGESYADYIEQHIFEPLGMADSVVVIGANPPSMVTGHRPWFGGVRASVGGEGDRINAPAGGIAASARDMGLYLAMWLSDDDDILSANTKTSMVEPSSPASPLYGLGWSIDPTLGTVYHTGLVPGAETLAVFIPGEGKAVVVMVNANGGLGFADTWNLIGGTGARALGQVHEDDGSRWGPKIAYLSIVLLPPLFLLFAVVSWRGRLALRAKRASTAGKLSLWFPLVAMTALAWSLTSLLPRAFGGSIATLQLYQPDFAWCLIAAAILAPAWAVLRLTLAYFKTRGAGLAD